MVFVVASIRFAYNQANQHSSKNEEGPHEELPLLRSYWQLMDATWVEAASSKGGITGRMPMT